MARVNFFEEADSVEPEIVDWQQRLPKKEKRRRKVAKRRRLKKCCLLLFFLVLLILLVVTTAAIAKTGIWEIPVFSRLFYQIPQPTRKIEIKDDTQLAQKAPRFSFNKDNNIFRMELGEEDMTFIIRQTLARQSDPYFAQNSQLVFSEGRTEFFGLLLKPVKTNITAVANVDYLKDQDKFDFKLTKVKLGDLSLPPTIVEWLAKKYGEKKIGQKLVELGISFEKVKELFSHLGQANTRLNKIEVLEGKIVIEFFVDVEKIKDNIDEFSSQLKNIMENQIPKQ